MSHSISKALVLSFLAHYLFVLIFLAFESEHSIEESLPVLNVEFLQRDDGLSRHDRALTEHEIDVGANAGSAVEEQKVQPLITSPVVEVSDQVVEEPQSELLQQPRSSTSNRAAENEPDEIHTMADAPAESREPASSEYVAVAATTPNEWTSPSGEPVPAAPEPEKIPVSDPVRSMLEKKIRQLGENLYSLEEKAAKLDWKHEGQAYTASFRHLPAEGDMGMGHVVVEVTKEEGGAKLTTQMRMKNLSFSNFTQFVNRWNPGVQIHDDELDGRFHSNSEVHLMYSRKTRPTFFGKVTTAHRGINISNAWGRIRHKEIFLGGLETGVKWIDMPKRYSPFPDESPAENDQVRVFEADTSIRFYPDGSYGWRHIDSEAPEERVFLSGAATYLVGAKKTALHVKGVVNGRVLVYSPERIVIEDDLMYAEHPDTVPDSDDYLGLVTDRYIEVAGPDLTGPGDLLINAAMYARRRFVVKNFTAKNDGTLSIHGSLATGSMSVTEPRYSTRIRFDKRLENLRPPRFPLTNRYETVAWDGNWETH